MAMDKPKKCARRAILQEREMRTRERDDAAGHLLKVLSDQSNHTDTYSDFLVRAVSNAFASMGVENMPYVPSQDAFWPSSEVQAVQSVSVMTLNPFSKAVRIVDSTQQFVKNPPRASVSMPFFTSCASRSVPGNASSPRFPEISMSPSCGFMASA
mmetsp:Transcript_13431/g.30859  ORF Transcript_13431/g.30859 Transcript_13431/m.30859 type:complete len:155 (+) Transcript_13431:243-707(+)